MQIHQNRCNITVSGRPGREPRHVSLAPVSDADVVRVKDDGSSYLIHLSLPRLRVDIS